MERPWVTQQAVAWRIAASLGRQAALPVMTGTARVKRTSMSTIAPGRLFNVTDAASFVALSEQNWGFSAAPPPTRTAIRTR